MSRPGLLFLVSTFLANILTNPHLPYLNAQQPGPSPEAGSVVRLPKSLSIAAGDLVVVKAESGAELVTWDSTDGLTLTIPKPYDSAAKSIAIHAKLNGVYALTASIPNGKETRVAICLVTVGDQELPKPKPKPDPDPPIPNEPVAFLVIIEETGEATANRGAMFSDAKLAARLKEKRIGWRVADQNAVDAKGNPPADLKPYMDKAKGKGLPQTFLIAANGKLLFQGDLPKDAAGLLELLAKYGG